MEPLMVPFRASPYEKYRAELTSFCKEHNLELRHIATQRVGRGYYLIEGVSSKAIMVAFITANPKKIVNIGWDRISKTDSVNLKDYHRKSYVIDGNTIVLNNGKNAKSITCWVLQVWEKEDVLVKIPFAELEKLKDFRETGDFKVEAKEDDYDSSRFYFCLVGRDLTGMISSLPLETGIDTVKGAVLDYLSR